MSDWNPKDYLVFKAERTQPATDLIAWLPNRTPKIIIDLGCGPGNSAALLQQAFPAAKLTGIDTSPAMIAAARRVCPSAHFIEADVGSWLPSPETDLVFSNALFQWLPERDEVMKRILQSLKSAAVFALQMPDNLDEPSHRLMRDVAIAGPWRGLLSRALEARRGLGDELHYYDLLAPLTQHLQIWRTTYVHPLENHEAIARMLSTTGLKPFLDPLEETERREFLSSYVERLSEHYPAARDGRVLFRFPRLFIIAIRA
jgi:trans-aconitate 2-methyltransferase